MNKMIPRPWVCCFCWAAAIGLLMPSECFALAGSTSVAQKGRPVHAQPHWPGGVEEFLNDPARTEGWNDFFSEWPNDVCNYMFHAKNTNELNKLLQKFGKIKSLDLQVRLAPYKEPRGLGWVTKLPEGNGSAAVFSIGDQKQIAQWYDRLGKDKRLGRLEFKAMPVAVPPTLTIYVQNPAVDLQKLRIPDRITVTEGNAAPSLFKTWNRVDEPTPRPPTKDRYIAPALKAIQ